MTMKWTIVLVCILSIAFGLKTVSKSHRQNVSAPSSASTFVYNQLVDHYDPLNTNTYSQRYSVDVPSSWSNGDPIFIFLAGEAPMEFFEFQEVQSRLWGKQFGAIYISLEHRFYGDSIPNNNTGNGPYSTENLRYLTSQQALADAAYFIENFEVETLPFLIRKGVISPQSIENKTEKQSKWIVFGCSYSGALSAWFRAKYSNLVVASVAPSGPVFAQTNYSGYYQLFQKVASPDCVAAVQAAVQIISEKLQTEDGRSYLASTFNSCAAIPAAENEQYYFLYSLTGVLGSSDQYENPEQWPLNQTCAIMTKSTDYVGNWAEVFATQNSPTLKRNVNAQCNDFNEVTGFIEPMRDTTSQDRSWVWQTCVEFGFFTPTVGSIFWPERIDLERQIKWCEQIYGIQGMTPNTNWTNAYYGGYDLHGTSIMFSNGLFDPWHLLSINEDLPWGVSAVTYEAGHCAPMIASYPDDPVSLVQARVKIGKFLAQALSS